jgi:hypothetical protein
MGGCKNHETFLMVLSGLQKLFGGENKRLIMPGGITHRISYSISATKLCSSREKRKER